MIMHIGASNCKTAPTYLHEELKSNNFAVLTEQFLDLLLDHRRSEETDIVDT